MKPLQLTLTSMASAVLLVALGVTLALWTFRQIEEAAGVRSHTIAVINSATELLSAVKDAETGQRGYLLTGDEAFLAPYLTVRTRIPQQLQQLQKLTLLGAAHEHLERLAPMLDAKLAETSRAVSLYKRQDVATALALVKSGEDKRSMDSIRLEMQAFIQLEQGLLAQREAEFQLSMRHLFSLILAASLLALVCALAFAGLVYRQTQQRLKNLIHGETRHLLEEQEATNTQLLAANARLRESEERLAVTLSSIGDAVIATDTEARVIRLNPVAEKLTGWAQVEAFGRAVEEVFPIINKETRLAATIPVMETLAHGTVQGLANHTVLIARDGSECDIADSCAPILDRDGAVVGAILVFRNVSEEYAIQQALRDSAALVQAILNTVADGIVTLRAQGGAVEKINPAAEAMFGYPAAELLAQNFSLLIPELNTDQLNGSLAHYSVGEEAHAKGLGREVLGLRKDGSTFPLEIAVSEMWLGGERYFTGILRDISARKLVEAVQEKLAQRLRDHQFYTRSLIESNIDALMAIDAGGIISDVNKQMEALTGCTRDELIGAPYQAYFTDPERAEAGMKQALLERKLTNYELTMCSRDGDKTEVSYNATTLADRDGKIQGVLAVARDITEQKRLDQVLQDKNIELAGAKFTAEKANLAKSDFLSSMSHELRTPLNAVLGFAQLMESGTPPPTPSQKRNLEQILKAGWYLLELINEILDLALIESGRVTLSREPVSLAEVMLESQAMIASQAHKRGIRMSFPRFETSYFIKADRTRMKQVLINLLNNAIKYNRPGGAVEVEYSLRPDNAIRISVRDTGAGLTPEQLQQLFQPFNRLGKETSNEEGTGIGLVVTKRLVELMGGVIGVESSVGEGSAFWVELSLTSAPKLAERQAETVSLAPPTLQAQVPRHTLLYVEDNPANLELVEQLVLRRPDLRLLSAAEAKLGIEFARTYLPEVILMDINLPGISGIQAMTILRLDPATAHIPIIALSANAIPRDIEKALEAGFFNYLTKPIKVHEFMAALDAALNFSKLPLSARKESP